MSEFREKSEANRNVEESFRIEVLEGGGGNCQTDSLKNEQTEDGLLFECVFSIPLVFKDILKNLDIQSLLRTSLVNKYWNFISREVIRDNEKCLAVIEGKYTCHKLKNLNALLSNSDTVPFNGMSISESGPLFSGSHHRCTIIEDLSDVGNNILEKINFKYLSVQLGVNNCVSMECIRQIILENANVLEGLRLQFRSSSMDEDIPFSAFTGVDLQGHWLPNVRVLEFSYPGNKPRLIMEELVQAAPKLQELYGNVDTRCLDFIVPLKAAKTVKDFDLGLEIKALRNCAALSQASPQLEKFIFSTFNYFDGNFSEWAESHQTQVAMIVKQLLKSSQDSLKNLDCNHFELILMISQWNIPVLKKLSHLSLGYNIGMGEQEGNNTFRKIDWSKYFPNLKEVELETYTQSRPDRDFYIDDAFRQSTSRFVCESVEILRWDGIRSFGPNRILKNIFPNLKKLYVQKCRILPTYLNELWTGWPDLELVQVSVGIAESICNYDSVFLGVSEEEATYLLESVEELESLEIVSTRPSIFNLRKLKKFVLCVTHANVMLCREPRPTSDSVFLSRLVGHCAFARMTELEVEIHLNERCDRSRSYKCKFAVDHLKPFVKCVDTVLDRTRAYDYFGFSF